MPTEGKLVEIDDLVDYWLKKFSTHYIEYKNSEKEPRYGDKQFLLNSYIFLQTLSKENDDWNKYLTEFGELFLRDPAADFYGYRSPVARGKERENTLEWANIFRIVNLVGYPHNKSAKEKMLINARKYIEEAKKSPGENYHDIMICAAIEFLPNQFESHKEWLASWITESISKSKPTSHQLIAYLGALKGEKHIRLRHRLFEFLRLWMKNPAGNSEKQILIWARIFNRLDVLNLQEDIESINNNLFKCLRDVYNFTGNWSNTPLILDAIYQLSSEEIKRKIHDKIFEIVPSKIYRLKEIFPFLDENISLLGLQGEVEGIKEKCEHISKENCNNCIEDPRGECWMRILAKITGRNPSPHGPTEVADYVVYKFEQGIYFVIKARPVNGKEGDRLFRQCVKLFSSDHALVFYWNPHETAPSVLKEIREAAASATTKPQFMIVPSECIRQVLRKYKELSISP
jgi:hypothetical protein